MQTLPGIDLSLDVYIADAIEHLRICQPKDKPYYGCFSGGKDSCVIKELVRRAGVNCVWHYNVTTIDPPELVHFIRKEHPDVVFERPECNFFTYAIRHKKVFPTRRMRWCCEVFKERQSPDGSNLILGVRAAESPRRKARWKPISFNVRRSLVYVCPIVFWSDSMVWNFIRRENIPYCSLYDEGYSRLGCIGCPMSGKKGRLRDFARWPGFERKWKKLFQDTWNMRTGTEQRDGRIWFGDRYFTCWEEMYEWWLNDEPLPDEEECQANLLFI